MTNEAGTTSPVRASSGEGEADTAARGPFLLDVRRLEGPEKHPTIHRMFDALAPGQSLTIINDHDPRPLFYELRAERGERFDAENYRSYEAGQRVWVAVIPTLPGA